MQVSVTMSGSYAGGLAAYSSMGTYKQCYSTGTIKGSAYTGGLIGTDIGTGNIENCFVLGTIAGTQYVAGIVGYQKSGNITNCYTAANLSGTSQVSGIYNGTATVTSSYYDAEASGIVNTTGLDTDRLTAAMTSQENYTDWDFDTVWGIEEGNSYPYLQAMEKPEEAAVASLSIEGAGTEENPYIIKTKEQFQLMNYHLSGWFQLANDIDCNGEEWVPIGKNEAPFSGHLDGKGYTVSNFSVINSTTNYIGLFAAAKNVTISNFNANNFSITGANYVGGLIGNGMGSSPSLTNCHLTEATVTGVSYVGGIAGSFCGSMNQCSFSGAVIASGNYAGGAAGYAPTGGYFTDCSVTGNVSGGSYVGGITGASGSTVYVSGATVTGHVNGNSNVGQFSGNSGNLSGGNNNFSGGAGSGTEFDPYIVSGIGDLGTIKYSPGAYYTLAGDIDGGGAVISPIGTSGSPFTGHFSGNGYTISNVTISGGSGGTGLFGVTNGGSIEHVNLDNTTIEGGDSTNTGGLVGYNEDAEISFIDCHITNTTIQANSYVGSLIGGSNVKVTMTECSSDAVINVAGSYIGGLAGICQAVVTQCCYTGTINAAGNYIGGLVGFSNGGSFEESFSSAALSGCNNIGGMIGGKDTASLTVLNCYAVGSLAGANYIGGIIGSSAGAMTMTNAYAAEKMSGTSHVGGLEGDNSNISVTSCYYDTVVSSLTDTSSWGRKTNVMIYKPNFIDWDFDEVWDIIEGQTYPYLRQMEMPPEVTVDISTASGCVVNALTGSVVEGVTVNIRQGEDNKTGDILDTLVTGEDGTFTSCSVVNGTYTGEVITDGYVTNYFNFTCSEKTTTIGDIGIVPVADDNIMTIVLTWGENPTDLDAHLTADNFHVYFANLIETGAELDLDDTSSYGPETMKIDFDQLPEGTYQYYVNWCSGSGSWAASNAKVQVYLGSVLTKEFDVPDTLTGTQGSNWNVFTIDSVSRTITEN